MINYHTKIFYITLQLQFDYKSVYLPDGESNPAVAVHESQILTTRPPGTWCYEDIAIDLLKVCTNSLQDESIVYLCYGGYPGIIMLAVM